MWLYSASSTHQLAQRIDIGSADVAHELSAFTVDTRVRNPLDVVFALHLLEGRGIAIDNVNLSNDDVRRGFDQPGQLAL